MLGGDRVANRVYWHGWDGHEREASGLWFELAGRSAVVLDVGAFCGYYALLAALANPGSTVVAFEPLAVGAQRLRRNVELNSLSNVEVVEQAVGRTDGTTSFWEPTGGLPTSSGLDRAFVSTKADAGGVRERTVEVTTIDAFVRSRGLTTVDLVKIDTETTEHDVLAGAAWVLAEHRPVVLCEVLEGGHADEIDALVRRLGYRAWSLRDDGPVAGDVVRPVAGWRNWLLVPEERELTGPGAR